MISLLSPGELRRYGMLGMNSRNIDFIGRYNERRLYPLVDNKLKTKLLAREYELPVPALRFALSRQHEVEGALNTLESLDAFAMKPAKGSGGKANLHQGAVGVGLALDSGSSPEIRVGYAMDTLIEL